MANTDYEKAVGVYRNWLKTPEGLSATDEQKRLKRRSLFMPTNRRVEDREDFDRTRYNLFRSRQADQFRRQYEAVRFERPNLTPHAAYDVVMSRNPNLTKELSTQERLDLYSRYVKQDTRVKGTDFGISNANYDTVLYDNNRSMFNKMLNMGAANFSANFANPVLSSAMRSATFIPALASAAGWGLGKLTGIKTLEDAGRESTKFFFYKPAEWAGKIAPTKERYADSGIGEGGLDRLNQGLNIASTYGGYALTGGPFRRLTMKSLVPKTLKNVAHPKAYARLIVKNFKQHPWRTSAEGLYSGVMGGLFTPYLVDTAGDLILGRDPYDEPNKAIATPEEVFGLKAKRNRDGSIAMFNNPSGDRLASVSPGANAVIDRLPEDHPDRRLRDAIQLQQLIDIKKRSEKEKVPIKVFPEESYYDDIKPISNPDNPAPAGSPPPSDSDDGSGGNKVSWWDSVDKSQLWKGGAAVGLGLLGLTAGGWKGLLSAGILGGLGYAYGDKLPEWWDDFMKAVNTK